MTHTLPVRIQARKLAVAIVSGGLDSTTLVYDMLDKGYLPHVLSFNYGQRHRKELRYALKTANKLGLKCDVVDLRGMTHLIDNSALTSCGRSPMTYDGPQRDCPEHGELSVPEGHYAEESMKATVVPNRNMIMLSIAAGVAVNEKAVTIGIGVHAGDHFVYPDCRPLFIEGMRAIIGVANEGIHSFETDDPNWRDASASIYAPFIDKSKADIAYRALELGVPLEETWSCYKGGDTHCGRCGTCVERLEAINEATNRYSENHQTFGPIDRTEYADTEFWRTTVNK
jgi:7-cyano-7-deazaguanine synthase